MFVRFMCNCFFVCPDQADLFILLTVLKFSRLESWSGDIPRSYYQSLVLSLILNSFFLVMLLLILRI